MLLTFSPPSLLLLLLFSTLPLLLLCSSLQQLQQQQTIKRPREDKEPESSSSSKRSRFACSAWHALQLTRSSRSEKHYKESRLLCEAASKYVGGSKVKGRAG